jgi:hypothetical protein
MDINHRLLSIIGRRIPAIFDIIPRGPQGGEARKRSSWAALNPQPLPPGPPSEWGFAALNPQPLPPLELGAAVAAEFIQLSSVAHRLGAAWKSAAADLDDWCPTVPRKPKQPPGWPPHLIDLAGVPPGWPDPVDPHPHPLWFVDFHLGFAARVALAIPSVAGTALESAFSRAVDRSIEAIAGHAEAGPQGARASGQVEAGEAELAG